jgi:hypothetical protein
VRGKMRGTPLRCGVSAVLVAVLVLLLVLVFCAELMRTESPVAGVADRDAVVSSSAATVWTLRQHIDLTSFKSHYLSTLNVRYRPTTRTILNGQSATNGSSVAARGPLPVNNRNRLQPAVHTRTPQFVFLC